MIERGELVGGGTDRGKRLFAMTPVILAVIQYTVLVFIMATAWFGRSPPEVPYTWHAPASSLLMGIILSIYYRHQLNSGKIPPQVFWSSVAAVVVTSILLLLALLFPERECCCGGGVQPQRVTKGTCPKPKPARDGAASSCARAR